MLRVNGRLLQQACRICKSIPTNYNTASRNMSLFPRFVQSEFIPLFRLLDDYAIYSQRGGNLGDLAVSSSLRSYQPKFDVKENKDSYELHGELPGIESKDVSIEFTSAQTLNIKGRTEHVREEGKRPVGLLEGEQQGRIAEGGEGKGHHKPSVKNDEARTTGAIPDAAKQTATSIQVAEPNDNNDEKEAGGRWWVSERSVGEFARTFSFPNRVDQENVAASLKNGILKIVIPKAQAPVSKRINIE